MAKTKEQIEIEPLKIKTLIIKIKGTAPVICNSKELVAEKLEADRKGTAPKDKETDPKEEFQQSLYEMPEWCDADYGLPSIMFKKSMVRAAKATDMSMTDARQAFFVNGIEEADMVSLVHGEDDPSMRRDTVSVGRGSNNDVRYRGQFKRWSCELKIDYNSSFITAQGVVELLSIAGFGVGIGDWRPQKDGQYGRFTVATAEDTGGEEIDE